MPMVWPHATIQIFTFEFRNDYQSSLGRNQPLIIKYCLTLLKQTPTQSVSTSVNLVTFLFSLFFGWKLLWLLDSHSLFNGKTGCPIICLTCRLAAQSSWTETLRWLVLSFTFREQAFICAGPIRRGTQNVYATRSGRSHAAPADAGPEVGPWPLQQTPARHS